jgi:hypothetical protein
MPNAAPAHYIPCDLLPPELEALIQHHLQVGTELRAAGDIAAAKKVETRADALSLALALAESCGAPETPW